MMNFQKILALLVAVLSIQFSAAGQTLPEKSASKENLWPGFGAGSFRQGDVDFARKYKTAEITGLSVFAAGAVGLGITAYTRDIFVASYGNVTKADYYVCGGLMAAGLGTFVISRICAYRRAGRLEASLAPLPGGAALSMQMKL